jgi:hypothetical protein
MTRCGRCASSPTSAGLLQRAVYVLTALTNDLDEADTSHTSLRASQLKDCPERAAAELLAFEHMPAPLICLIRVERCARSQGREPAFRLVIVAIVFEQSG